MIKLGVMIKFQVFFFFFQAEDGIRDQPRSRGLGDVYKRQIQNIMMCAGSRSHYNRAHKERGP
ncbi:hypothetical protein AMBR_DPAELIID_02795 [Lacticaseibacillus rhamnosus]|nr:hypothetical protein AMBR_DPAELIID_02795 [Lacticaseibacillus rhamnosus]